MLAAAWLRAPPEDVARSSFDGILERRSGRSSSRRSRSSCSRPARDAETLVYAVLGAAVMGIWSSTSTSAGARDAARALARDARAARRAPDALLRRPPADHGRDGGDRALQHGRDAALGPASCSASTSPSSTRSRSSLAVVRDGRLGRRARLPARRLVRPLPHGLGAREPARVPGLADRGFLVPLTLLPAWVQPISWVLAPTWGMSAIREPALGGAPWARHRARARARRASTSRRHPRARARARARAPATATLALS